MSPLEALACTVVSRTWLKRSHAWRFRLTLPDDTVAAVLSNMLEAHVYAEIVAVGMAPVKIDPACIVDVPHKGTRCFLDLETVSEAQNGCGAALTLLLHRDVRLSLRKPGETVKLVERGDVRAESLRGLHMTFFQNREFWLYVERETGHEVRDPATCKSAFKAHHGVASCTELRQDQVRDFISGFNAYLGGRNGPTA